MIEYNFDEVLEEHENIIFYLLNKLGIRDPEKEFYQEGMVTLWKALATYDSAKGKFSSYAYFRIEKSFLTMIRTRNTQAKKVADYLSTASMGQITSTLDTGFDPYLLEQIKSALTVNQMKWFTRFILEDLSIKEIAVKERVTVNTVKNWARHAKPKLRKLLADEEIYWRQLS
ncbi:sigma-70 family RNA polymerase sigma factor [Aquibacillus albus]|uniref:RNA polymerase sigma factor (Sigma-70 family) n=1 Tax=Aquibacillus albus TaxID=1168171 RepID=A0ABS2N5Z6_9BACI|nr:sigma-70 family RNA polymerase sigma factor [Aquibacillus albus]MBM7573565.1 RNA polymerase sigma factor (sigma-70 family) [Aquibacillus albus]